MNKTGTEGTFLAQKRRRRGLLVIHVFQIITVDFSRNKMGVNLLDLSIGILFTILPGEIDDRIWIFTSILLIEFLYPEIQLIHDIRVRQ
jgi:hypothetical protein